MILLKAYNEIGCNSMWRQEVALMTADGFEESPLSTADDLRFGGALQRSQQLDCGQELSAAVTTQFCDEPPLSGSAAAVIYDNRCEAGE